MKDFYRKLVWWRRRRKMNLFWNCCCFSYLHVATDFEMKIYWTTSATLAFYQTHSKVVFAGSICLEA
jgi:hypothetical protein